MTTATLLSLRQEDVHQPQPWPIVLDHDGKTIVHGRPDAEWIVAWSDPETQVPVTVPTVGYKPIFSGLDGKWFSVEGVTLAAEPEPYDGDLEVLRRSEATYREALTSA